MGWPKRLQFLWNILNRILSWEILFLSLTLNFIYRVLTVLHVVLPPCSHLQQVLKCLQMVAAGQSLQKMALQSRTRHPQYLQQGQAQGSPVPTQPRPQVTTRVRGTTCPMCDMWDSRRRSASPPTVGRGTRWPPVLAPPVPVAWSASVRSVSYILHISPTGSHKLYWNSFVFISYNLILFRLNPLTVWKIRDVFMRWTWRKMRLALAWQWLDTSVRRVGCCFVAANLEIMTIMTICTQRVCVGYLSRRLSREAWRMCRGESCQMIKW